MNRKRFLFTLLLAVFMSTGLALSAHAWQVNEFSQNHISPDSTDIWYQIVNDSAEKIVGFGVGAMDMDLEYGSVTPGAPYGGIIGDWWGYITTKDAWDDGFTDIYGPSGYTTFIDYFGMDWETAFGDGYNYAYVTVPDYQYSGSPGFIAAGTTYHETDDGSYTYSDDFGFTYYPEGEFFSPVIAMFDESGTYRGETGQANGNPVPIPGALWLLGSGLFGLVAIRRRKKAA